eukprot:scaffold3612_cov395-Prasinococcus_capsulatus_cf.AAC.3
MPVGPQVASRLCELRPPHRSAQRFQSSFFVFNYLRQGVRRSNLAPSSGREGLPYGSDRVATPFARTAPIYYSPVPLDKGQSDCRKLLGRSRLPTPETPSPHHTGSPREQGDRCAHRTC